MGNEKKQRAVVVTTTHRGVFFGYIPMESPMDVKTIRLERARMCVYWSSAMRGIMGLASIGPDAGCKIGPAVPAITLQDATSVIEVSDEAAKKWEEAAWAR